MCIWSGGPLLAATVTPQSTPVNLMLLPIEPSALANSMLLPDFLIFRITFRSLFNQNITSYQNDPEVEFSLP